MVGLAKATGAIDRLRAASNSDLWRLNVSLTAQGESFVLAKTPKPSAQRKREKILALLAKM